MQNIEYTAIFKLGQSDFEATIIAIQNEHAKGASYLNDNKKGAYCCNCTSDLLVLNKRDFDRSLHTLIVAYGKLAPQKLKDHLRSLIPDMKESADKNFKQRIIH
jgi:hypothetical protein